MPANADIADQVGMHLTRLQCQDSRVRAQLLVIFMDSDFATLTTSDCWHGSWSYL